MPNANYYLNNKKSPPIFLWMDFVRGIAILAVISLHSITIAEKQGFIPSEVWKT